MHSPFGYCKISPRYLAHMLRHNLAHNKIVATVAITYTTSRPLVLTITNELVAPVSNRMRTIPSSHLRSKRSTPLSNLPHKS
jgi:hypothetical protein